MKNLVIGVTSSIACYKIIDLINFLKSKPNTKANNQLNIEVILTKGAETLVKKEKFEKALGKKVHQNVFEKNWNYQTYIKKQRMRHIHLADNADLILIAPATANIIGKLANGVADDLLSTTILATKAPVLICPAMNVNMWENKIVQNNITKLKKAGYHIIEPDEGMLACGWEGKGRLADIKSTEREINQLLNNQNKLKGKNILVTAGATIEPIDPIRYITNKSSGKMGIAIAEEASKQGANVTLVRGKTEIEPQGKLKDIKIETVQDMYREVKKIIKKQNVMIHAAAVSDFYIKEKTKNKIKSGKELALELSPTTKILEKIKQLNNNITLIGFKAEHNVSKAQLIQRAKKLKQDAKADIIVANDVGKSKVFGSDSSNVLVISKQSKSQHISGSKQEIARNILKNT